MKERKFKSASLNNRKKQITFLYTTGKEVTVHYSQFGIKTNLNRVWVDKETGNHSIGIEYENGEIDYIPFDQPLALVNDAGYLLQDHIEHIILRIKEEIKKKKLSKKYLARQLKTSDNQIQRLLNPTILNKNLSQLYQIASLLKLEIKMNIKRAA